MLSIESLFEKRKRQNKQKPNTNKPKIRLRMPSIGLREKSTTRKTDSSPIVRRKWRQENSIRLTLVSWPTSCKVKATPKVVL